MDVLEAMSTARSTRRFTTQPVETALVEQVLTAGTFASSPNNTQGWTSSIVTDADVRAALATAIRNGYERVGPAALPTAPVQ
jgi:nitroreductase